MIEKVDCITNDWRTLNRKLWLRSKDAAAERREESGGEEWEVGLFSFGILTSFGENENASCQMTVHSVRVELSNIIAHCAGDVRRP